MQGPPGTGKTHTLAWAILARAYAAARDGPAFHVLVTAMTHTAVEVVLRSIVDKLEQLDQDPATRAVRRGAVGDLRLFKEQSTPDAVPDGVEAIDREDLLDCLEHDLAVIAAVPSGVHRLLQGVAKPIDWARKYFDLLVIDEASQLSLPAAVLAGAPLKEDGQAIVVGDHRQMPPILAHDWKHEPRRGAQDARHLRVDLRVAPRSRLPDRRARSVVPASSRRMLRSSRTTSTARTRSGSTRCATTCSRRATDSTATWPRRSSPSTRSSYRTRGAGLAQAQRHRDRHPRADHPGGA